MFYPIAGDLGFNHEEMTGISILFQLLYHNPKVLYSPNVTAVRDIISKVSSFVTLYSHQKSIGELFFSYSYLSGHLTDLT